MQFQALQGSLTYSQGVTSDISAEKSDPYA